MATIPFLIKLAREPEPRDTAKAESGNKQPTDTQAAVIPQTLPTTFTKVRNETTDET